MPAIILALVVALSGGTAFAAENSIPGDTLYPVKISVNESVREFLAFSDEAKAEVETSLAERRLSEAERLAAAGRLTEEQLERLQDRFEMHADRVRERIQSFEESERDEAAANISSRLEASLQAHEQILSRLSGDLDAAEGDVTPILRRVREHLSDAAEDADRLEVRVRDRVPDVQAAAERKKDVALKYLSDVETLLARQGDELDEQSKNDATEFLKQARERVREADAKLSAEEHAAAFRLFQEAHRLAIRAHLLIRTASHLTDHARIRVETRLEEDKDELRTEIRVETRDDDSEDVDEDNSGRGSSDNDSDDEDNDEDENEDTDDDHGGELRLRDELRARLRL